MPDTLRPASAFGLDKVERPDLRALAVETQILTQQLNQAARLQHLGKVVDMKVAAEEAFAAEADPLVADELTTLTRCIDHLMRKANVQRPYIEALTQASRITLKKQRDAEKAAEEARRKEEELAKLAAEEAKQKIKEEMEKARQKREEEMERADRVLREREAAWNARRKRRMQAGYDYGALKNSRHEDYSGDYSGDSPSSLFVVTLVVLFVLLVMGLSGKF